jgi:hypothetical protein
MVFCFARSWGFVTIGALLHADGDGKGAGDTSVTACIACRKPRCAYVRRNLAKILVRFLFRDLCESRLGFSGLIWFGMLWHETEFFDPTRPIRAA